MRYLFAVAVILSASPLAAQQVVSVKSGEHDGFSRLVLRIDPDVDWEIVEFARLGHGSLSKPVAYVCDRAGV